VAAVPSAAACIFPPAQCAPPAGSWSIKISASQLALTPPRGEYPAQPIVKVGDPSATSGSIVFGQADLPCILSTGPAGNGEYQWSADNGVLTFTLVKDECVDRILILTPSSWTKDR
jgi:hypothetical protein